MTEQPKKYFIRFSNLEDHDKIMEFYRANPHDNVCDRHEDLMRSRADTGSIILVEDEQGKIVGASVSHPLFINENGVEHEKWLELGTTRMVLNGYNGLFDVMVGLQVLRAYLVEPPDDRFVCQMESPYVRKMAHKLGFRPYTPSDELVRISDATVDATETSGYENWYSAGPEALPVLAKFIAAAIDKPFLEHVKTGEHIQIDLGKSSFFKMFETEIRGLANSQSCGDPDNPDYSKSVEKHRRAWMQSFFK